MSILDVIVPAPVKCSGKHLAWRTLQVPVHVKYPPRGHLLVRDRNGTQRILHEGQFAQPQR